ncbi:MAG: pyridoxamine 5'-phosphate oxidase family protein [Clostridia bacterium]|nr:pyridoxamine 5'-phosphate oxidase family protein [Clostridia bacterium]
MFRKMRRFKQELSMEECFEVLKSEPRGVLAVHGENGYPYALPMNHILLGRTLYFHSATEGHKLDAIDADNRVSFCAIDKGVAKSHDWALNFKSVIVFGRLLRVDDKEEALNATRQLGLKFYPTADSVEEAIDRSFDRVQVLKLEIDHISGKRVKES